jgi:hypothetical protein
MEGDEDERVESHPHRYPNTEKIFEVTEDNWDNLPPLPKLEKVSEVSLVSSPTYSKSNSALSGNVKKH